MAGVKNTQAEVGVIATLIQHPEFILVEQKLKEEYFTEPVNRVLFNIIKDLYVTGIKTIDEFCLSTKINNSTEYINVTKGLNLEELVNNSIFVAREDPGEYKALAQNVIDFARTRKFISVCQSYAMQGRTEGIDIIQLQNKMYDDLSKISDEFTNGDEEALIGEKIDKIYEEIVRRAKDDGGLLSKFPTLNEFVTYDKGELVVFSAKRKVGKSVLLLNEAVDKAKQGKNILYLDSEMSDIGWSQRLLALISGVSIRKIKDQTFDDVEEEQKVLQAIKEIKTLPIVHINNPAWTLEQLEVTIKNWNQKLGLDLVFMDYIKAPDTDDAYVELGKVTNFFKNKIAVGLDLSVVAAAQSNRGGDTGESYRIEQFCSTLIKLVEKSPEEIAQQDKECGQYKLFVALNRNGKNHGDIESDYIDVDFTGATMTMTEGKKHETQDLPF